jgi:prepilin peptidase CpaA
LTQQVLAIRQSLEIGSKPTMTTSVFAAMAAMLMFAFTTVYAGFTDLMTRKIRNGSVLFLLLTYAVLAPLAGFAADEIGWSAAVAFGVLLLAFTLFALGWVGGGDAKLAGVTALWFGTDHAAAYLVYTALLGGAFALAILLFRIWPLSDDLRRAGWIAHLHSPGTPMPYGVPMALAALVVLPATHWMTTFL